jgi:hypothetical protein
LKIVSIDPAPRRTGPTWSLFLRSQAEAILACDFFMADLLDGTQAYVPAVIEHASRRVRILGVTLHPTGGFPPTGVIPTISPWQPGRSRAGGTPTPAERSSPRVRSTPASQRHIRMLSTNAAGMYRLRQRAWAL